MKRNIVPPYLYLNGLFILIMLIGFYGIFHTQWVGSGWFAIIWAAWIMVNYLFFIRIKLCRYCEYYARRCPLGWGQLVPLLCSKGEEERFSKQKWPVLYLVSYALIPTAWMFISLIFQWDFLLFLMLVMFVLIGILLYWLASSRCCKSCKMRRLCLMSKINSLLGFS